MKSRIEHPCVKDGQIKLDTLTDCTMKPTAPEKRYYYYTPGYTVYSILVQLHGVCVCVCVCVCVHYYVRV